ncbi:uncharacterized protein KY384_002019 [Bacidia gigantensis]|uniref:uncharacterized protein n=1 Tax=Bacidia gigantensis TaxID=2732470 RepID=UPI001D03948B|nr:uncharacterized protein KY384_002019 [Bacidia gigantensis]KAG8533236.1 hypothetical protein KY384_002019 [Bacidia gigantensis]
MNGPLHSHHFPHDAGQLFSSHPAPPTLASPHDPDLDFNPFDPDATLHTPTDLGYPFDPPPIQYDTRIQPRFQEIQSSVPVNGLPAPQHAHINQFEVSQRPRLQNDVVSGGGQFGILTPRPQAPSQPQSHNEAIGNLQNEIHLRAKPRAEGGTTDGHFSNLKMVPDPPDLAAWRQRLFDVDNILTLTEDEFQTYFPHVDNIYSHRSTQKYKRKPFVSHYWDCRLKGRPPGTAKSDDPSKKKRKRTARERDLCDVKIKITEYFPGPKGTETNKTAEDDQETRNDFAQSPTVEGSQPHSANVLPPNDENSTKANRARARGERYYQVQRVNGNGANGKDLVSTGGHKHSLDDSDKIKKNSVVRHFLKEEKDRRKSQNLRQYQYPIIISHDPIAVNMASQADTSQQKTYHKRATGAALQTVKRHAKDNELKLYGSCFCPFVQRVWISLEVKGFAYQYIEIDPYKKPDALLAINPRGLIPALKHGDWGCYESSVLMEYLEDLSFGFPLLPQGDPKSRAHCRLWSDHINRKILPQFYGLLQAQETEKQTTHARELQEELTKLIDAAEPAGPFFLGPHLSFVDVQFAPWVIRFRRVLQSYRGWPAPEAGSRWARWVHAIEGNESVKATTSADEMYLDSYERYAENRPGTSQLANAINAGGSLP